MKRVWAQRKANLSQATGLMCVSRRPIGPTRVAISLVEVKSHFVWTNNEIKHYNWILLLFLNKTINDPTRD